jgi:hypothetical protein
MMPPSVAVLVAVGVQVLGGLFGLRSASRECHWSSLLWLVVGAMIGSPVGALALTRLRGFAVENANFEIFQTAKYLICKGRRLQFWPKTAVVKTYPIPNQISAVYAFRKPSANRFRRQIRGHSMPSSMRSLQIHEKPTEKSPALLPGQVSGTQVVPQSGMEKPECAAAESKPPIEDGRHNVGASLSRNLARQRRCDSLLNSICRSSQSTTFRSHRPSDAN